MFDDLIILSEKRKNKIDESFKNNNDFVLGDGWNKYGSYFRSPPIPGVSKSLQPGGKEIENKHMFDDFPWFWV